MTGGLWDLRRRRFRTTVRLGARQALGLVYVHQRHVWSWLELASARPHLALTEGLRLDRVSAEGLADLAALGASFSRSRDWLAAGHELWLVRDGGRPVFSVWLFTGQAPTAVSPTGWVPLPPGTVNLEDSVTDPDYRGRGVAPAAYTIVFDILQRTGQARRVVGSLLEANDANRRALTKSGWREFALVDVRRVGLLRREGDWRNRPALAARLTWTRVRVLPPPGADAGAEPEAAALRRWLAGAVHAGERAPRPAPGAVPRD